MRMYIRLLHIILVALSRKSDLPYDGESVLHFTVMPWDCVVQFMGNDRYHAFMDLGRVDLLMRLGAWEPIIRGRLQPFVANVHIRHRHRLAMLRRFTLRTRLIHADNRFYLMEHIFQSGEQIIATAISRNGLTRNGKIAPTDGILHSFGYKRKTRGDETMGALRSVEKLLRGIRIKPHNHKW